MLKIDLQHAMLKEDILDYQEKVTLRHQRLHDFTGEGNDFLGWLNQPVDYELEEVNRIIELANKIRDDLDVLLVCGIGGSYLGARAAIDMIKGLYPKSNKEVIYIGNTLSSTYLLQVLNYIENKSVYLNVISKSGSTTETAVAFRFFKSHIEKKYGVEKAKERIFATTSMSGGILKNIADECGYETFKLDDNIGGRYSVLSPVGLLPLAIMNIDIKKVLAGAKSAYNDLKSPDLNSNSAYRYAVARRILDNSGYPCEMLVGYDLHLNMFTEWWKQLFGESEGKSGKGLLPTSCIFSTDLHSMGQFIQEGRKCLFETILMIDKPKLDDTVKNYDQDLDELNYLNGKSLDWINKMAFKGTLKAHTEEGNIPNIVITIDDDTEESFGYLVYFFFKACAMSVYLLDENPFNQPGVEVYKKNMFKLLGKIK